MSPATAKPVKGPTDPDHHAAWLACREPWEGEIDLRGILDDLLKSGWSIQSLKEYAHKHWRYTGRPHVTRAAWRVAVKWQGEALGWECLERNLVVRPNAADHSLPS